MFVRLNFEDAFEIGRLGGLEPWGAASLGGFLEGGLAALFPSLVPAAGETTSWCATLAGATSLRKRGEP